MNGYDQHSLEFTERRIKEVARHPGWRPVRPREAVSRYSEVSTSEPSFLQRIKAKRKDEEEEKD